MKEMPVSTLGNVRNHVYPSTVREKEAKSNTLRKVVVVGTGITSVGLLLTLAVRRWNHSRNVENQGSSNDFSQIEVPSKGEGTGNSQVSNDFERVSAPATANNRGFLNRLWGSN